MGLLFYSLSPQRARFRFRNLRYVIFHTTDLYLSRFEGAVDIMTCPLIYQIFPLQIYVCRLDVMKAWRLLTAWRLT